LAAGSRRSEILRGRKSAYGSWPEFFMANDNLGDSNSKAVARSGEMAGRIGDT
jgi:hypothetical protein